MNGGSRQKGTQDYFALLNSGRAFDELTEKDKEVPGMILLHILLTHPREHAKLSGVYVCMCVCAWPFSLVHLSKVQRHARKKKAFFIGRLLHMA